MWDAPPIDPGIEIALASHGMSKGLSQTDGPQLIAKGFLQVGDVQIGTQWKNVNSNSANGEFSGFVNLSKRLRAFQLTAGAAYKRLTKAPRGVDSDCLEVTAGASRKLGRVSIKLNAIFSPDDLGSTKRSLYLEGGPAVDITKALKLSANLGHRFRENAPNYMTMNAGASFTPVKAVVLDLRYYRTDRGELGDAYHRRLVLSAKLSF